MLLIDTYQVRVQVCAFLHHLQKSFPPNRETSSLSPECVGVFCIKWRQIYSLLRILRFADSQDSAESRIRIWIFEYTESESRSRILNFQEKSESRISNPNLNICTHRIRISNPNLKNDSNLAEPESKDSIGGIFDLPRRGQRITAEGIIVGQLCSTKFNPTIDWRLESRKIKLLIHNGRLLGYEKISANEKFNSDTN